jgi:hypothetical protein
MMVAPPTMGKVAVWSSSVDQGKDISMLRNTVRGILALALTAVATWLANRIADKIFGPEEISSSARS